jgi:phosphocarrier protein HPr
MLEKEMVIQNRLGLHARAASTFVQTALEFKAEVFVAKDGLWVNGKDIVELMALAAPKDTHIVVRAHGEDEREALEHLCDLIGNKFGED